MNHSIEQISIKYDAVLAVANRLKEARDEGESYEMLSHLIDSLNHLCVEVNREKANERELAEKAEATRQCGACGVGANDNADHTLMKNWRLV
jgi:hypothetical protein